MDSIDQTGWLRGGRLFLFALGVFPYFIVVSQATHGLYLEAGRNVWHLLIWTLLFGAFLLGLRPSFLKSEGLFWGAAIVFLSCLVLIVRWIEYGAPPAGFAPYRFPFMLVFCFLLAWTMARSERVRLRARAVIFYSAVIQALAGIVHYHCFPFLEIGQGRTDLMSWTWIEKFRFSMVTSARECGFLVNASVYANFITLGLFLLATEDARSSRRQQLQMSLVAGLMTWGVFISKSRFPSAVALLLMLCFVFRNLRPVLQPFVIGVGALATGPTLALLADRVVEEGNTIRDIKTDVLIKMFQSPLDVLIGVDPAVYSKTTGPGGITFSDNSFGEFALDFGLPLLLLVSMIAGAMAMKRLRLQRVLPFLLYLTGSAWLTNCVLWDIWVLFAAVTLFVLNGSGRQIPSPRLT